MLSKLRKILQGISLIPKMLFLTVVIGALVWGVLDYVQTGKLKRIFDADLLQKLQKHHQEDRAQFDSYVGRYNRAVKLLAARRSFQDYVSDPRFINNAGAIVLHSTPPPWLPEPSVMRKFVEINYAILIDGKGIGAKFTRTSLRRRRSPFCRLHNSSGS